MLVQIKKFLFPIDFVIQDTKPVRNASSQIPVIFGHPFLDRIDTTIKIRSGIMTLVFGNMTLNFKIFWDPRLEEFDEEEETSWFEVVMEKNLNRLCQKDPIEFVLISSIMNYECYPP